MSALLQCFNAIAFAGRSKTPRRSFAFICFMSSFVWIGRRNMQGRRKENHSGEAQGRGGGGHVTVYHPPP